MNKFLDANYNAIKSQSKAIAGTIRQVPSKERYTVREKKRVIFVGAGDSYAVAEYGKWAFISVGINALSLSPPELSRIPLYDDTLVVGVTASGRSLRTIDALKHAKSEGVETAVLTDNPDGTANNSADSVWLTYSGIDTYNISPSVPTTCAMAYLLKLAALLQAMPRSRLYSDSVRLEREDIGKDMVDWAEKKGGEMMSVADGGKPLYLIADGPNHVAAQLGMMKFNEYSHVKGVAVIREEFQHHWNLSIVDDDRAILITDSPVTDVDEKHMQILTKTLNILAFHLSCPESLHLESPLGQAIANTIALQMAAYYYIKKHAPDKDRFKLPHAEAFKIY